ncbi:DUF2573 family protein [Tumebacillus flagellatus]|uniref:DUF2573 domain-containing protein n=1 Tax=Tumebacillus flagellatus TaxID=1157490 RepID=A0A074LQU1_9BACL|nr:DUF2573 family protein [Tumebacillus flagellatus]KEO84496.1 hypothetical protein EL26_05190 [Tumebacillus flagellatus]
MTYTVPQNVETLLKTFTEMMTGESSPENVEAVLQWAIYMHVRSVMPPLVQHWRSADPENAQEVSEAIKQVQALNAALKEKRAAQTAQGEQA